MDQEKPTKNLTLHHMWCELQPQEIDVGSAMSLVVSATS